MPARVIESDRESSPALGLRFLLSREWIIVNDVAVPIRPAPGAAGSMAHGSLRSSDQALIDRILVGPPGAYLVFFEPGSGMVRGVKDRWARKRGDSWVDFPSPTWRGREAARFLAGWIDASLGGVVPGNAGAWVFPVVLFTGASRVKALDCSAPVFRTRIDLMMHVRRGGQRSVLGPDAVNRLARALAGDAPLSPPEYTAAALGRTLAPRPLPPTTDPLVRVCKWRDHLLVRVTGTREQAESIRLAHLARGDRPTPLRRDRHAAGTWYFHVRPLGGPSGEGQAGPRGRCG